MLLNSLFTKFVDKKPFSVMARAMLERMLSASRWDELFRTHASTQYERDLLLSQWVEVVARVVTRVDRSVLKAIEALRDVLTVTDDAVYQKLQRVETPVCQALVRDSFREARQVIAAWKVEAPSWLPTDDTPRGSRQPALECRGPAMRPVAINPHPDSSEAEVSYSGDFDWPAYFLTVNCPFSPAI